VSTKNLDYDEMLERRQIALNRGDPVDAEQMRPTVQAAVMFPTSTYDDKIKSV
jgi:hypothetical protein